MMRVALLVGDARYDFRGCKIRISYGEIGIAGKRLAGVESALRGVLTGFCKDAGEFASGGRPIRLHGLHKAHKRWSVHGCRRKATSFESLLHDVGRAL